MIRRTACARMNPQKVAEVLASGGAMQQPMGLLTNDKCPACGGHWDITHMLVVYEGPGCEPAVPENTESRERRQLSILLLELAEEFFLRAHQWKKKDDGYFQPPKNYRFRKEPSGQYDRSHAVNSQKQVYNPLYAHERQWEGEIACGRTPKGD